MEVGPRGRDRRRARWPTRMEGADVFFGLSAKGALTAEMVPLDGAQPDHLRHGQSRSGDHARGGRARSATTPSWRPAARDYPNQVNNVLGFPYIFRGALDVRATHDQHGDEDRRRAGAGRARAARTCRTRSPPPTRARGPRFGRDYIIPVPFDPRLIHAIPPAVAQAAMDTGVARRPIVDMRRLPGAALGPARSRRRHAAAHLRARARAIPKRVVFAEGEEEQVIRAADVLRQPGPRHRHPGRPRGPHHARPRRLAGIDLDGRDGIEIHNARLSHRNTRLCAVPLRAAAAQGLPVPRLPAPDQPGPQPFRAPAMVALGDADAMVTGVTRNYSIALDDVRHVIDAKPGHRVIGVSLVPGARAHRARRRHRHHRDARARRSSPRSPIEAAGVARRLGYEPRVALLAFSTFGHPPGERAEKVQRGGAHPRPAPRRLRV